MRFNQKEKEDDERLKYEWQQYIYFVLQYETMILGTLVRRCIRHIRVVSFLTVKCRTTDLQTYNILKHILFFLSPTFCLQECKILSGHKNNTHL